MSSDARERVDAYLDSETVAKIETQLGYGDSVSGWVRDAVNEKLERECDDWQDISHK